MGIKISPRPVVVGVVWLVVLMMIGLAGCGGGGGGGGGTTGGSGTGTGTGGSATASPTNVVASGANGRVTVSWTAAPGATSYNVYWSTTTGVTTANGIKVAGATSPYVQTGLSNGTTYYYIVTAVSSSGESTPPPQVQATPPYSNAAMLDTEPNGTTIYPDAVSVNSTGAALAVWEDWFGGSTGDTLFANIAQSGVWAATPAQLSTTAVGAAGSVTPLGDAFVVFEQKNANLVSSAIYAATYSHGTKTWSAPALIAGNTSTGSLISPAVATDGNGNATALWTDQKQVYALNYNAASGVWAATPAQISSAASGVFSAPQIVVDGTNTFTAVWTQPDASGTSPYVARYSGGTWSASKSVGFPASTTSYSVGRYSVAANPAGNISVVWEGGQTPSGGSQSYSMYHTEYNPTTKVWSAAATLLTPSSVNMYGFPQVALDGTGNATAVYQQQVIASGALTVWASRYSSGSGSWSGTQQIDLANGDTAQNPVVGMDGVGNAEVVWEDFTKGISIERRYNVSTSTWLTPNSAAFQPGEPLTPVFSMNTSGYGLLLGQEQMLTMTLPLDTWAYFVSP